MPLPLIILMLTLTACQSTTPEVQEWWYNQRWDME